VNNDYLDIKIDDKEIFIREREFTYTAGSNEYLYSIIKENILSAKYLHKIISKTLQSSDDIDEFIATNGDGVMQYTKQTRIKKNRYETIEKTLSSDEYFNECKEISSYL
jgi:hypothetical protein